MGEQHTQNEKKKQHTTHRWNRHAPTACVAHVENMRMLSFCLYVRLSVVARTMAKPPLWPVLIMTIFCTHACAVSAFVNISERTQRMLL